MNSYANPAHEQAAASLLKQLLPDVFITASTELSREWYEYERTATAAANAYVGAGVNSYVRALDGDLRKKGFFGNIYMMGSNGGVLSVDRTCQQPIALVKSGPIGGCIGAGVYAETLGFRNVIAFDVVEPQQNAHWSRTVVTLWNRLITSAVISADFRSNRR